MLMSSKHLIFVSYKNIYIQHMEVSCAYVNVFVSRVFVTGPPRLLGRH